jgi:hypothetical protein
VKKGKNKPKIIIGHSNLMLISGASSFLHQLICFLFASLSLLDIPATAKNIGSSLNITFDVRKLHWFNGPGITGVHVADLHPLLPAEVGCLCNLAIRTLDFDDTTALGWLRGIVALLGDISVSPEPKSTMNLYIMSMLRIVHIERLTAVALRMSVAWGKSSPLTKPGTSIAPSKSMKHCASV